MLTKRQLLGGSAALFAAASGVRAQAWPTRPLKLIVPYPPGGSADVIARLIALGLEQTFGQPCLVENRAGAGGQIGVNAAMLSEPDGYTLGFAGLSSFAVTPHVRQVPYRPDNVNYVSLVTRSPYVVIASPHSGFSDFKGLVDLARSLPGKLNYGSSGVGTGTHLAGELMANEAKIDIVHIAYKGGAPSMSALLAGEVQFLPAELSAAIPMLSKIKVIAVLDTRRSPRFSDVPTTAELGYSGLLTQSLNGIFAPLKTPAAVVQQMNAAVVAAVQMPAISERLSALGVSPETCTAEAYRSLMVAESAKWGEIIRTRHIQLE